MPSPRKFRLISFDPLWHETRLCTSLKRETPCDYSSNCRHKVSISTPCQCDQNIQSSVSAYLGSPNLSWRPLSLSWNLGSEVSVEGFLLTAIILESNYDGVNNNPNLSRSGIHRNPTGETCLVQAHRTCLLLRCRLKMSNRIRLKESVQTARKYSVLGFKVPRRDPRCNPSICSILAKSPYASLVNRLKSYPGNPRLQRWIVRRARNSGIDRDVSSDRLHCSKMIIHL